MTRFGSRLPGCRPVRLAIWSTDADVGVSLTARSRTIPSDVEMPRPKDAMGLGAPEHAPAASPWAFAPTLKVDAGERSVVVSETYARVKSLAPRGPISRVADLTPLDRSEERRVGKGG